MPPEAGPGMMKPDYEGPEPPYARLEQAQQYGRFQRPLCMMAWETACKWRHDEDDGAATRPGWDLETGAGRR